MDVQVSYLRLLIADNNPPYTYTDTQLRSAINFGPPPALPSDVVLAGIATMARYPGLTES